MIAVDTREASAAPTDAAPTVPVPVVMLNRLATLLGLAVEASWAASDEGEPADWSTQGEPVAEALRIVRDALP